MDVKTSTGLLVSVEAVKKPENSNKVQELAAMEEALKKATEEAHNQRIALTGDDQGSLVQNSNSNSVENRALAELKKKQEDQKKNLLDQLAGEEKQRQMEIK